MSQIFKKVGAWFSDKRNWVIIAVILFAIAIRLYYFFLTKNQPLWWDEAEYMLKAKSIALGTPTTGWSQAVRPILFPFLSSLFFLIGIGDIPIRFIMVILSVTSIALLYFTAKNLFSERVGIISAILMSVFYIDLFYTTRLLVDVPQILFVGLAMLLFVKYAFGNGSKKLVWFILPIILIGTQLRFTVALMALILFIFLFITQGFSLFTKKEWYISAGIAILCLVPYLIYSWMQFHNPLYVIMQGLTSAGSERGEGVTAFSIFMQYIKYFPSYIHISFFILFILGLLMTLFYFIISLDKIKSNPSSQKYLLLLTWMILPVLYFGFFVNHFEDRYIYMIFPAVFMITALAFDKMYLIITKYNKAVAIILVFGLLVYGGFTSIQNGDKLIKSKLTTYDSLRDAGLWIKQHSDSSAVIMAAGMPQLTYYSERATYPFPINETDFLPEIKNNSAQYMVISIWENSPQWTYDWPQRNQDKVNIENAFFLDASKKQPSAVIYSFKNTSSN